jgi:hypothetical protein
MTSGPEWFAPKRYGYGAGVPIAWQGWLLIGIFLAVVGLAVWVTDDRGLIFASIVVPATLILMAITARTTRGGWRWRWGERD